MAMRDRGFTVMEMMVVLIIVSMALMLGFQSLEQWQRAEAALDRISATTRARALTASWWTDSIRALTPVEKEPFHGSPQRMEGYSLSPVFAGPGALTAVQWSIVDISDGNNVALRMEENGGQYLLPLVDASGARFRYLSADGEASDTWPPGGTGLESTDLPAFVELLVRDSAGNEHAWIAHVIGPLDAYYKPFRLEDDDY